MSYLITGGTAEDRQQKALEMAKNQFHASNFDTIIIAGETSIGIGQIRDLGHQLSLKPYNSEAKVAIIHPGEILTLEAQNSLLKTLEEPNQSSVLILTAPQTDFLLPTIVSRCQIIRLETKPEIQLDEKILNTSYQLLTTIIKAGAGERLKFASTFKNKDEIKEWLTKMLFVLHEILLRPRHPELACTEPVECVSGSIIVQIIRNLEKTRSLLDQNINHKLALEIFLLDLPNLPKVSTQSTPGVE